LENQAINVSTLKVLVYHCLAEYNALKHTKTFTVLFEDNHLLIVNKASGVLVQGDVTGDIPLVELCKNYVKERHNKPGAVFLGVVHRIDRPVSGVVVFARTSKALERMNALFREKETKKTYWAIVGNKPEPEQGILIHWLVKDEKKNKVRAYAKETPGALRSELSYQILYHEKGHWLLKIMPVTGRPHQIRVQLASLNCPIKGDVKYGYPHGNEDGSICLHARELEFTHPVRKENMKVKASLPKHGLWEHFLKFELDE
jgi:23S rRNA pseudouridine1911/1915/1917 synthase